MQTKEQYLEEIFTTLLSEAGRNKNVLDSYNDDVYRAKVKAIKTYRAVSSDKNFNDLFDMFIRASHGTSYKIGFDTDDNIDPEYDPEGDDEEDYA